MGTAGIQNSPYRHTGINDILTHAQQDAVEMVSKLDGLVTNKDRGHRRVSFNSDLGNRQKQKTLNTVQYLLMRLTACII